MIRYPSYDNSILNLVNSIEKYFGVEPDHSTLKTADEILARGYRNVAIMVFDGMGSRNLRDELPEESFLLRHMREEITSVFPPTTTAATTTIESGLSPAEHTWLGWSLHFPEVQDNVNIFINTNDYGETVADYPVALRYIPYRSVVDKIREKTGVRAESVSRYGTYYTESFEELIEGVEQLCREEGRHYLYTYWNEPDTSMHRKGITSEESTAWMERINTELERLSHNLQDTVLFVIADHGHIDGKSEFIGDYPELVDTLRWLPSIEPRSLTFYIKDGREEEFCKVFRKHFQEDFILLSRKEVLEQKLFGEGRQHPRFEEFLGDYLAIATGERSIFNTREEAEAFIGVHAGLTVNEMMVPLIVIEKK